MLSAHRSGSSTHAELVDWLVAIGDRHDLTLAAPKAGNEAMAIALLLNTISREFSQYREVVRGVRTAARRNAEQLTSVVQATLEQTDLVRATAAAASQAGTGATLVAAAAQTLRAFAQAAATSATEANTGMAHIGAALGQLEDRLKEGTQTLTDMRRSTTGVADFLVTLARLSRHAVLLAVNASIEAAHLAEGGSRFAIVAHEVRNLSTSTRDSRADVAQIVKELRDSTARVAAVAGESSSITVAAASEIAGAGAALSQTGRGVSTFEQLVITVADVAATQCTAIEALRSSIDEIAHHTDEAAGASRSAGELDLETRLVQAEAKIGRWTLRHAASSEACADTDFSRWTAAIAAGEDASARSMQLSDPDLQMLATAVVSLLDRVDAEQREILADVVQIAVSVSRNGFAWRSISEALAGVSREIGTVRDTVDASVRGSRASAEMATQMRTLVETIRTQHDGALNLLEGALTRISGITSSVAEIDGNIDSMNAAARRADTIMALIETLSSETDLLSLNAAIEAAHAGDLGRGFSIIAEEIRALARLTNDATISVSAAVSHIALIGNTLQASIGAAAARMIDVGSSAQDVRRAIATLREAFDSALNCARDVATTANDQARTLDLVLDNINRTAAAFDGNQTSGTDRGRLELALIGSRAHAIASRRPIGTVIARVRTFGETLCVQLEAAIEAALLTRRVSLERLFDLQYRPIVHSEIAALGRLFDVSRVPAAGFNPVKYATPWDAAIDEAMNDILESFYDAAADFSPVVIFVSDLNGLFYSYPRRKIAAWTNDFATDNAGNRIKRMFEDEYALQMARLGLGGDLSLLGPRSTYDAFRRAGCMLDRAAERPWGGYVYARDTNVVCNEVAMALYVHDQRHSTLRICYDPNLI